jgi:hypothetical protein
MIYVCIKKWMNQANRKNKNNENCLVYTFLSIFFINGYLYISRPRNHSLTHREKNSRRGRLRPRLTISRKKKIKTTNYFLT